MVIVAILVRRTEEIAMKYHQLPLACNEKAPFARSRKVQNGSGKHGRQTPRYATKY